MEAFKTLLLSLSKDNRSYYSEYRKSIILGNFSAFSLVFIISLFIIMMEPALAGTTSTHSAAATLQSAQDDVESLIDAVAPFIAILSFLIAIINVVTKFHWAIFVPAFALSLITSFGVDVLKSFFSATI